MYIESAVFNINDHYRSGNGNKAQIAKEFTVFKKLQIYEEATGNQELCKTFKFKDLGNNKTRVSNKNF